MQGLLGMQPQAQQQGNLLGNLFQTPQQARNQSRNRLFENAIAISQNPNAGIAVAGGLLGETIGRAMGRVTPEEDRAMRLQGLQGRLAEQGLDPSQDPYGFFTGLASELNQMGMQNEAVQAMMQAREFAPERPELKNVREVTLEDGTRALVGTANGTAVQVTGQGMAPLSQGLAEEEGRPLTQTEQQIQFYMNQGYSERMARDLAYGQIQLDSSGRLVNITGGDVPNRTPDGYNPPPLGSVSEADTTGEVTAQQPEGILESPMLTGFIPFVKRGFEGVAGQFSGSAFYPELNRYKTRLRSTERQLVSAWATSSRPPLLEQEKLAELFPGLGPLESPRSARVKLEELGELLLNQRQADLQDLNNTEMSPSLRTEIQKRVNATERTLRFLDPQAIERGSITTFDQVTPEQAQSVLSDAIRNNTIPSSATLSAYDSERGGFYILDNGEIVRDANGNPYFIDQGN